tara:strand:+ start:287 stop:532 length:246 start_codon:yes stop_codon:yes gene_type:complete
MEKRVSITLRGKAMTIDFIKDKETKNTIRFTASGDISGSVYIQKDSELAKQEVISVELAEAAEVTEEVEADKEAELTEVSV